MSKVTLVITSMNRPKLLEKTLESFVKYNTYPIHETIIIDDSGIQGCNDEILSKYINILNITSIYNEKNIGQVASIDKAYSLVKTDWIFHCEEDWEFLQNGFIEKSFKVFEENPNEKIFTVWLRPHWDTSNHPIIVDDLNRGYYMMSQHFSYTLWCGTYTWCGVTFNPGLRKTSVCMELHPYSDTCPKFMSNGNEYIGEYEVNTEYASRGYYSMILSDPNGHVNHIGYGDHIMRPWD